MRKRFITTLNIQTLTLPVITAVSCFIAIRSQIRIHYNLMLFSLINSFPLVCSLQSTFRRPEKAREYLSIFDAYLKTGDMKPAGLLASFNTKIDAYDSLVFDIGFRKLFPTGE
jgi:hypothetical protein